MTEKDFLQMLAGAYQLGYGHGIESNRKAREQDDMWIRFKEARLKEMRKLVKL